MAIAPIDEDDEDAVYKNLDGDVKLLPDQPAAVQRLRALQDDQQRKVDYQDRLERKLRTLDTALSQQRDEVESLQRTLQLEKEKDSADQKSRQVERQQKTEKQEERIRNSLADVLYRKAPPRPGKKKSDQTFELDTVLISFIRPHDHIRYNLPFRVDSATTLKTLRDDACKYWDVSTEDFILKTMANSKCQNEIMVQDCFKQGEIAQLRLEQKNREQANVTEAEYKAIAPRNRGRRGQRNKKDDIAIENVMKFNDKWNSTLKKLGGVYFLLKLRDMKPSEHFSKIKPRDMFIFSLLAVLTFLLYYYQRLPGEQYWMVNGIENSLFEQVPRNMANTQFYSKSPGAPEDTSSDVPGFRQLKTYEDVWDWLQISMPYILWRNTSGIAEQSLATYNNLQGYVNIRQKSLKSLAPSTPLWSACDKFKKEVEAINMDPYYTSFERGTKNGIVLPGGTGNPVCPDNASATGAGAIASCRCFCYHEGISPDLEQKTDVDGGEVYYSTAKRSWAMRRVQDKAIDFIRGPAEPSMFVSAEENNNKHGIESIHGRLQVYDEGGFSVNYRASLPNKAQKQNKDIYQMDMQVLKEQRWIDPITTRALFISFAIYNAHYDLWASISLNIEMPPSGHVIPTYYIRPYLPNLFETTSDYVVTYVLFLRLLIAGYIIFVLGVTEMRHKTRNQKAGFWYYFSLNGTCDVIISICIVLTIILRFLWFARQSTAATMDDLIDGDKTKGYICQARWANRYEFLFILEGVIFCFTMIRLISLFRINRTIYMLWVVVGRTLKQGGYLALIFIPVISYFTLAGHRIWGATDASFATLQMSFISVMHMTKGALNVSQIISLDSIMAAAFYLCLYIFVTFLLLASFTMVFIESYYVVMLTRDTRGEKWSSERWKQWLVHPVLLSVYHYAVKGSASPDRQNS